MSRDHECPGFPRCYLCFHRWLGASHTNPPAAPAPQEQTMNDQQQLPSRFQIGNPVSIQYRVVGVHFDEAKVRYDLEDDLGVTLCSVDSSVVGPAAALESPGKALTDADAAADLAGTPRPDHPSA